MMWSHRCKKLAWTLVTIEDACPWCGESYDDQLAFARFYLTLLMPSLVDEVMLKQKPTDAP